MCQQLQQLARRAPGSVTAFLVLGVLLVAGLLAPAEVNGDGIGYLKQLAARGTVPGHPAYLPLARLVAGPFDGPLLDAVWPLRLLSLGAVGAALLLFAASCRRLVPGGRWLLATMLLASAYAVLRAAHQVEVYALAFLAAIATLYALSRVLETRQLRWSLAAGLCAAMAALLHLSLAALALPVFVLVARWSRPRDAFAALAVQGSVGGAGLLWAAQITGHSGLWALLSWIRGADHGMPYPLRPWTPLVALWGLARSLLAAPYPHQARLVFVVLAAFAALALLLLLAWLLRRPGPSRVIDGRWLVGSWVLPLGLFGLLFYPSDTERWLFVLPVLALWTALLPGRLVLLLPPLLLLANGLYLLPAALDQRAGRRARAAERLLRPADLLISPGHGWAEGVGLGTTAPPRLYPLLYEVGRRRGLPGALRELDRRIDATLARGGRVYVARLEDRRDPRGFKELAWFGLTRAAFGAHFARYCPRQTSVVGLWRLRRLSGLCQK